VRFYRAKKIEKLPADGGLPLRRRKEDPVIRNSCRAHRDLQLPLVLLTAGTPGSVDSLTGTVGENTDPERKGWEGE